MENKIKGKEVLGIRGSGSIFNEKDRDVLTKW